MVKKAQQTGSAVGQRQGSIVESRLRIVPSWFHTKDLNNSPCSGKSTLLLLFPKSVPFNSSENIFIDIISRTIKREFRLRNAYGNLKD